ncbi:hypothetical protein [Aliarcobacter butzleri]|uniref:hypothetical protein n=1 Tax=Aliarcobacter butzleri TaxID=28197 RepID=UPI00344B6036
MTNNKIQKEIKKYIQINYSFDWGMKLLEEIGDKENSKKIHYLRQLYESKAFNLMKENNINQIEADVTKNIKITLKIDQNFKNK